MSQEPEKNPFKVPRRHTRVDGDARFTVRGTQEWVGSLPLVNTGEVARQLYIRINELNATDVPYRERIEILETLYEPLSMVLRSIERRYLGQPLPLHAGLRKLPELVRRLWARMAVGHKIVLLDKPTGFFGGRSRLRAAQTVGAHRALFFYDRMLLNYYQLYEDHPRHIWQEIHNTYSFARRQGMHERHVENLDKQVANESTIEEIYKRVLLLALAGPNSLRADEIRIVAAALERHAGKARLLELSDAAGGADAFVVEMDHDSPPTFSENRIAADQTGWVLYTQDLADALGTEIPEIDANSRRVSSLRLRDRADLAVPPELAEKLMLRWGVVARRGAQRHASYSTAQLLAGLQPVYQLLRRLGPGTSTSQQVIDTTQESIDLDSPSKRIAIITPAGEYIEREATGSIQSDLTGLSIVRDPDSDAQQETIEIRWDSSKWATSPSEALDFTPIHCSVVDHSTTGVQLACRQRTGSGVRLGDMVATRSEVHQPVRWRVGQVRWLKIDAEGRLRFGVELLPLRPRTALLRMRRHGRGDWEKHAALVMGKSTDRKQTLMTPVMVMDRDDEILLVETDGERPIELIDSVSSSGMIGTYLVAYSGKAVAAKAKEPEPRPAAAPESPSKTHGTFRDDAADDETEPVADDLADLWKQL
ncbi:MAG: hypothetical protein KDG50_09190 [Chromatiales bacterium]|nr:hypothetical protein [Chromatiales bacterium]